MDTVTIATIVIPSVYHAQLQWFLERNVSFIRDHQVIIVSSAAETTQAFLDQFLQRSFLITISKPLGFAKTVNLGMRQAETEWIGTCNDDVELRDSWLENFVIEANETTGGINPVICAPTGGIESAGIALLPIGKAVPKTINIPDQPFETEALNAACVLYRRAALEQVGYFDETFGSYLEDIDLSLTLVANGWSQLVVPGVTVVHHRHQTTARMLGWKKQYYDMRNWWLILLKHWTWQLWWANLPGILLERARNCSGFVKAVLAIKG